MLMYLGEHQLNKVLVRFDIRLGRMDKISTKFCLAKMILAFSSRQNGFIFDLVAYLHLQRTIISLHYFQKYDRRQIMLHYFPETKFYPLMILEWPLAHLAAPSPGCAGVLSSEVTHLRMRSQSSILAQLEPSPTGTIFCSNIIQTAVLSCYYKIELDFFLSINIIHSLYSFIFLI